MRRRSFVKLGLATGVTMAVTHPAYASSRAANPTPTPKQPPVKRITPVQRKAAAVRARKKGLKPGVAGLRAAAMAPDTVPHYFGPFANYANSPVPTGTIIAVNVDFGGSGYSATPVVAIDDAWGTGSGALATVSVDAFGTISGITVTNQGSGYSAPVVTIMDSTGIDAAATPILGNLAGGIRKFVDQAAGLIAASPSPTLNQYIPFAAADTGTYPGCDYYEIELGQYSEKFHSDIPATTLRGYRQTNGPGGPTTPFHYLGPVIVAKKGRPVRIKFTNMLPADAGGNLFIPVDTTVMGSGMGPTDMDGMPGMKEYFSQNRGTLHLHGGLVPWISDGTPHQWTTPASATTPDGLRPTPYPKGVSVRYVPDMWFVGGTVVPNTVGRVTPPVSAPTATNDPGPGSMTFYYNNEQSARLMFYHDHAWGITRLNVYAGEAAPYLLYDDLEMDLIKGTNTSTFNPGLLPVLPDLGIPEYTFGVPLVIQDKTFVDATTIVAQDPTWKWGTGAVVDPITGARAPQTGDLWVPSVYMPAQNPEDLSGASAFGRWQYGPWFWPPTTDITQGPVPNPYYDFGVTPWEPSLMPGTPSPSMGMEAFNDTMMVNGTIYPYLDVLPRAYRFRILNAANDRFVSLNWYVSGLIVHITAGGSGYTTATVAFSGGGATTQATGTVVVSYGVVTGIQITNPGVGYTSPPTVTIGGPGTGAVAVASLNTEVKMVPAVATPTYPPKWSTDGRAGGVPDPNTAGPAWIQIGTEGGFLPAPVVVPNQPLNWNMNATAFNVGNVTDHALLLGCAERADVIVDFTPYAGQTLILYSDAPAAFPALDSRYDYYTGNPSQMDTGGAPTTQPGYGPNTRTIMQVRVAGTKLANPPKNFYNAGTLTALRRVFAKGTLNPNATTNPGVFASTQDNIILPQAAYNSAYDLTFPATAAAQYVRLHDTSKAFTPIGATAPATITFKEKAAHDEMGAAYDTEFGRMGGLLGLEMLNTTNLTQNIVLYGFSSPPVEVLRDSGNLLTVPVGSATDGTQIWKITHNGVDTHPIHVHLFNVQLINRVAWDGALLVPELNELGWKETVRMNPLEDIIVAMRPTVPPNLPFDIPNSIRLIDPSQPEGVDLGGAPGGFVDPSTIPVRAITVKNHKVNFGWEYVWHCHILSHEEMDMMHAIAFAVPPRAPTNLKAIGTRASVTLTWNDNCANETAYIIQRARVTLGVPGAFATIRTIAPVPGFGGTGRYVDTTVARNSTYQYKLWATNVVGDTASYGAGTVGFPKTTLDSAITPIVTVTTLP